MPRKRKYRVGIVGCGRIAGFLEDDTLRGHPCTHVGAYHEVPQVKVVACCSLHKRTARRFAKRFSIPRYYKTHTEMLAQEKLDILSIATYAPSHAAITVVAAAHKVKGIFCEKAMATSLAEADQMIAACKKNKVVLSVNHTRRWGADYELARKMIRTGAIGTLQSITGTFSGHLLHTGIHMLDLLLFFAGAPRSVAGFVKDVDAENFKSSGYAFSHAADTRNACEDKDAVFTVLFKSGVVAQVTGIGKPYFIFELDIYGSTGRIRMGNGLFSYWRLEESREYSDFYELHKKQLPPVPKTKPALVWAVEDLLHAVERSGRTRSSGEEARKSLELALAVYESHTHGGRPIPLPLKDRTLRIVSR